MKPSELERAVELGARRADAILILLDADDACPAELGPELARRAAAARPDRPIAVVLAKMEFEAWFLAASQSLRARGLLGNTIAPPDSELVRDAKGRQSLGGPARRYSETLDQARLAAQMDLAEARRAPSFERCYREIVRLLAALRDRAS